MSTERALALTPSGLRNLPVAPLAAEQRGSVGREQLLDRGWSRTTVDRARRGGDGTAGPRRRAARGPSRMPRGGGAAGCRFDLEVDGAHHAMPERRRRDALRDADLRSFGVTVLRVPATLVLEAPDEFVRVVRDALVARGREIRMSPRGWG
jgi:hypothetical protein